MPLSITFTRGSKTGMEPCTPFANGVIGLGLQRGERIAIYLEKRFETVIASFGAPAAGCVFVPLNPLLKPEQVAYIMRDCNVRMLVTSPERYALLTESIADCHDLRHVVCSTTTRRKPPGTFPLIGWQELLAMPERAAIASSTPT
jgi:acyl-CoA synthetase (AMP-forming)/AMP-acid ligase II